jgi:glyoxalase family protein
MPILGLHHVTATVDEAQPDLDFCIKALGLRLVKKTVNFDNHFVYHFYYGDGRGAPGTIWTTFPYAGRGVAVGKKGAGQVTVTSFSVPVGSLDGWRARLGARGIAVNDIEPRFGEAAIAFADSSGLTFELIATARDDRTPWVADGNDGEAAIRGLHSVTILVRDPAKTPDLMTGLLGYHVVGEAAGRIRVAANGDAPGHLIDVAHDASAEIAVNGLGTVHHVAMAIGSEQEQLEPARRAAGWLEGHRSPRSLLLKSIYFQRAGQRVVRSRDGGAGFHRRRRRVAAGARFEAAAVGGTASRGDRKAAGGGDVLT